MKKISRLKQELFREPPKLVRQRDCIRALQSEGIFKRCVKGGWIAPVVNERKYTVYRRSDLEAVIERIMRGEMPPQLPSVYEPVSK